MKSNTTSKKIKDVKEKNKKPTGKKTIVDKATANFIVPLGNGNKKRK